MEFYTRNYSLLQAVLFIIISSEHCSVLGGIFNKQNPVTIQHDLYKFIETTKGTSKLQSPAEFQQEFHSFIRKTGGAAELGTSSTPTPQAQSSYVPSTKPQQGELHNKTNTWERHKRSSQHEQTKINNANPFDARRNFDQNRYTSTSFTDLSILDRIPKNDQTLINPRPKELTNIDFGQQRVIHKHTVRPETFFRSQRHSHNLSNPQDRLNPFLHQPIDPHRSPISQNTNHRFITQNEKYVTRPHTQLSNTKLGSRFHTHSHQFSKFNNRPQNTAGHHNAQVTLNTPQTDHHLGFSRPNSRPPGDFTRIVDRPVTSGGRFPESNIDGTGERPSRHFIRPTGGGCRTSSGLRHPGEVWYANRCRRHKCIGFRGRFSVETDQCDTEIYNTVYKCIIEVDIRANFPDCCPKYRCNPDNLGNNVK